MPDALINLYSDTQTLPTEAMYAAMAAARLGDDTHDLDPTVHQLEAAAAKRLGKEAGLLTISGNMANLVALMVHGRPGDEVLIDPESHIYYYETGSLAGVAGLMPMCVPSHRGLMDPADIGRSIRGRDVHFPIPRLLCLENTHNRGGGRIVPLDRHRALCAAARAHGLSIHLDGARLFNAAVATGLDVREYTRDVDSVMFCLSKGLSCPLGSVLCGSREFIAKADHARKRLGGGMRQAGIIAAAGIVALNTMVDRLAEDHANARRMAELLQGVPGLRVNLDEVETNMMYVDHTASGRSTNEVLAALEAHGVLASDRPPTHFRLVTNRHHDAATVEEAVRRIRRAMESIGAGRKA
jgi:threonine aldolase